MFDVCVVGSSNLDLVVTVARHPRPGETLLGTAYDEYPGGKGLNQVVAAARAGGRCTFVSALGDDGAGDDLAAVLVADGVAADAVQRLDRTPTGRALITVDSSGENTIVVVAGANAGLRSGALPAARVVLAQLEIPVGVVADAFAAARAAGAVTILNPAPAAALPDGLVAGCTYVIANEHEYRQLGGAAEAVRPRCRGGRHDARRRRRRRRDAPRAVTTRPPSPSTPSTPPVPATPSAAPSPWPSPRTSPPSTPLASLPPPVRWRPPAPAPCLRCHGEPRSTPCCSADRSAWCCALVRATRRQPRLRGERCSRWSGHQRPAWPGNALNGQSMRRSIRR